MPKLNQLKLCIVACATLAMSCAQASHEDLALEASRAELAVGVSLDASTRVSLASVVGAENSLFTSMGRLLVTGDKGIYELVKNPDKTVTRTLLAQPSGCQFGGITEARGVIYANCYGITDSYLYAAALGATPSFRQIAMLKGRGFANGLTADPEGRLYIATTWQNQILRFTLSPSDPFTVSLRETWLNNAGVLVNGLKYAAGYIYWTDGLSIQRVNLRPDGYHDRARALVTEVTVFDDIWVDEQGILAADFGSGLIRQYDLNGTPSGVSGVKLSGPSSVARALGRAGFSDDALIVTERSANRVSELY